MMCKLVGDIPHSQLGTKKEGNFSGWLMSELMSLLSPRFPPAALALIQLAEAEDVTEAGKTEKIWTGDTYVEKYNKETRQNNKVIRE